MKPPIYHDLYSHSTDTSTITGTCTTTHTTFCKGFPNVCAILQNRRVDAAARPVVRRGLREWSEDCAKSWRKMDFHILGHAARFSGRVSELSFRGVPGDQLPGTMTATRRRSEGSRPPPAASGKRGTRNSYRFSMDYTATGRH